MKIGEGSKLSDISIYIYIGIDTLFFFFPTRPAIQLKYESIQAKKSSYGRKTCVLPQMLLL